MSKPSFNDDFYCRSVEEWENKTIPALLFSRQLEWAFRLLLPLVIVGFTVAGKSWQTWLALACVTYVLVQIFTFLEELNENVRFVRHQLRTFRDAVRRSQIVFGKYNHPETATRLRTQSSS